MENQITCQKCASALSTEALFCFNCGTQVKCKECQTTLNKGAMFCTNCGTHVMKAEQSTLTTPLNKVEYEQKGDAKKLNANFTDEVGFIFANALNGMIGGHPVSRSPFHKTLHSSAAATGNKSAALSIPAHAENKAPVDVQYTELLNDALSVIFKQREDGTLELSDGRVKEKNQFDKVRRLCLLYMYAQKTLNIETVSREQLLTIIKAAKLSGNSNFRKYLSMDTGKSFSKRDNGDFALLGAGEDEAKKILAEICNPEIEQVNLKPRKRPDKSTKSATKETTQGVPMTGSALAVLKSLLDDQYFDSKRKLGDIVGHCKEKKAVSLSSQSISNVLARLVKDNLLERQKSDDGGYEYWKKQTA